MIKVKFCVDQLAPVYGVVKKVWVWILSILYIYSDSAVLVVSSYCLFLLSLWCSLVSYKRLYTFVH